jgi:hypothetical protein
MSLMSKPFVADGPENWKPIYASDGRIHEFQKTSNGRMLSLTMKTGLDMSRYPSIRMALMNESYRREFPNLGSQFEVLGPGTGVGSPGQRGTYNCLAWAVGRVNDWVWIQNYQGGHMLYMYDGMDSFLRNYGYQRASTPNYSLERGVQKIAVYAKTNIGGEPGRYEITHVALQMPDGTWTSKLGGEPLIRHLTPQALNGPKFGQVVAVYTRRM